jgi:hypothetical protein
MGAGSGKVFIWPAAAINNDGLAIKSCTNASGQAMAGEPYGLRLKMNEDVSAHAAWSHAACSTLTTLKRAAVLRMQ